MTNIEFHGYSKRVASRNYADIKHLATVLYSLTSAEALQRECARWAVLRAIKLLAELRLELMDAGL